MSTLIKNVYLAGPDVFCADAVERFAALEAACSALGLRGIRPSDGGCGAAGADAGRAAADRIYRANVELIRHCDALLANLVPFRNSIEPDSGTVFELGVAVALGKTVAGVLADPGEAYETRVARHLGLRRDAAGRAWDQNDGHLIEEFGQPLNLMLARSTPVFATAELALQHLAVRLDVAR